MDPPLALEDPASDSGEPDPMDPLDPDAEDDDTGGASADGSDPERGLPQAYRPLPAISGGTLLLLDDDRFIVAADPDRDLIHVFDRIAAVETAAIELPFGSEPGRVAEDGAGLAYVALRRTGDVAVIDVEAGELIVTHEACRNARGIAFDDALDQVIVACTERRIVMLDDNGVSSELQLDDEPRDIISADPLRISLFRSTTVTPIGSNELVAGQQPQPMPVSSGGFATPAVALRTLATPTGWLMLHRLVTPEPLMPSSGGYYGPGPCGIPAATAITQFDSKAHDVPVTLALNTNVVDLAINDDGTEIALVGRDAEGRGRYARLQPFQDPNNCLPPLPANSGGDPIAVAYDAEDNLWIQSREPAELYRIRPGGHWTPFDLSGASVADAGHDLFHRPASGAMACATCHPEGREDGFTFVFADFGARRTPALNVGLRDTEPFHWAGDLADMSALAEEVRVDRMLGEELDAEEKLALERFVFELPPERPPRDADDDAALRGADLFELVGCGQCHAGPSLTNNQTVEIGEQELQVPPLLGVYYRPPFMHDGRSGDLHAAVVDMLSVSNPGGPLTEDELDELVAYLESV